MLENIISRFKNSRNISEKRKITSIVDHIESHGYNSDQVYASMGEDSAAIRMNPNSKNLILLTTDAIIPEFVKKSPYAAGFSSIYVGIDDILACGGTPLACSTIISYSNDEKGKKIFKGILDATHIFKIPLVRGHTTTDSSSIALSSTIIGKTTTGQFLSAGGANVGDILAIIWDQDGKPGEVNPMYWNTILMKDGEEFYQKRSFLEPCIRERAFRACKDISNGGILGTLYQMLKYSKKGANLHLEPIKQRLNSDNIPYSLEEFLFSYLTSGFLVSCHPMKIESIKKYTEQARMSFYKIGIVTDSQNIILQYQTQKQKMIDFLTK